MSPTTSQAVIPSAPTRRTARKSEAPQQVIDRKALEGEIDALARAHAGDAPALRKAAVERRGSMTSR